MLSMRPKPGGYEAVIDKEIASSFKLSDQGINLYILIIQRYNHNDIASSSKLDSKIFLPPEMDISSFTLERSRT